jgi:hypothetical protein
LTGKLISADYTYTFGVGAGDLDRDGDTDIVSTNCSSGALRDVNDIYWFENDGTGNFRRHTIVTENRTGYFERHRVFDITRDGFLDVVIVDNFNGDVVLFENSRHPRDGKPWKRRAITEGGLLGAYDVDVADFDGDGWTDVVASSYRLGNQFGWFRNPGASGHTWLYTAIDTGLFETRTARAADFNQDGRTDLLGTANTSGVV